MISIKEFGERLRALRKEHGMTQLEVARKLEITPQAVSKWESGGCLPDCLNLQSLSELYGISMDILMQIRRSATAEDIGLRAGLLVKEHLRSNPQEDLFSLLFTVWKHISTAAADQEPVSSQQTILPDGTALYDERGLACLLHTPCDTDTVGTREWELLAAMSSPAGFRLLTSLNNRTPVTKAELSVKTGLDSEPFHSLLLLLMENRIIEYITLPDGTAGYRLHPTSGTAACLVLAAGALLAVPAENCSDLSCR